MRCLIYLKSTSMTAFQWFCGADLQNTFQAKTNGYWYRRRVSKYYPCNSLSKFNYFCERFKGKKTKFLEIIKEKLNLHNLNILYGRAEEISPVNADIVTFRAVGKIKDILPLAKGIPHKAAR